MIGLDDIIGAGGAGRSNFGPLEVGAVDFDEILARDLPRSFVGVPPTVINGGQTREIQVDVQREMRPDRLVLASDNPYHRVRDIRVGTVSLNASPNPVPASVFSPPSVGTSIRATMTATPSIGIQLVLENASPGENAWYVRGAFFGPSARPGSRVSMVGAAPDVEDELPARNQAEQLPQSFVGIPYTMLTSDEELSVVYIQVPITRDIRPDRLVLDLDTASHMLVKDIRVGTTSLNASRAPALGQAFITLSFGTRLRATVTATPSVGIALELARSLAGSGEFPWMGPCCGAIFGPSRYAST